MSKLTQQEVKDALKISRVIQDFLDSTGDTMVRSTDVFPSLVVKGLYEKDQHNGINFRRFLRKLASHGELKTLIPQCTNVPPGNGERFNEWYFHSAKDKMPKVIRVKAEETVKLEKPKPEPMVEAEAMQIIETLLEGYNPLTEEEIPDDEVVLEPRVHKALRLILKRYKELAKPKEYPVQQESFEAPKETGKLDLEPFLPYLDTVESWGVNKDDDSFPDHIQEIRKEFKRAYESWEKAEDEMLIELFNKNAPLNLIAALHKRQPSAIKSRMKKLNLI